MTMETKLADPAILTANIEKAWGAVCEIEYLATDIKCTGLAIDMAALDLDEEAARGAFVWFGKVVGDLSKRLNELQSTAFHSLHGCRTDRTAAEHGPSHHADQWRQEYDALHEGGTLPLDDREGIEQLGNLEKLMMSEPIQTAQDALAILRIWLANFQTHEEGEPAKTVAQEEADLLANPKSHDYPDQAVALVLGWLVKICEEGGAS